MIQATRMNIPELGRGPNDSEWMIGQILESHQAFNEGIESARAEIELHQLMPSSESPDIHEFLGYKSSLSTVQRQKLTRVTRRLVGRYNLSETWVPFVETCILTNHLIVPPDPSIIIDYPPSNPSLSTMIAELSQPIHTTGIFPLYRVTTNQLINFIRENRPAIEQMMNSLPPKPTTRMARNRFWWGRYAWLMRQDNPPAPFSRIANTINQLTARMSDEPTASLNEVEIRNIFQQYSALVTSVEAE